MQSLLLYMKLLMKNWIAPVGPHIDAFEQEICDYIGGDVYAAALNSGTAALHIALQLARWVLGMILMTQLYLCCSSKRHHICRRKTSLY